MFERFSDRARRVVVLAQDEARRLRHNHIGPEHVLLAVLQGDGLAAKTLDSLGVSREEARRQVEESVGTGSSPSPPGHIPFSLPAKKVLELSLREALGLGHNYIGTEHILLGLLRQGEGAPGSAVRLLGVDAEQVRARIQQLPVGARAEASVWSPALTEAGRRARQAATAGAVTTGQLLASILADPACQATRALEALGVTAESVEAQLAQIPLAGSTDAPPAPRAVEIKLGGQSVMIEDPDVAAALGELTQDQLRAALQQIVATNPKRRAIGTATSAESPASRLVPKKIAPNVASDAPNFT